MSDFIERIVDDARWCPTPENTQGWQFIRRGDRLELRSTPDERRHHTFNHGNTVRLVNLGFLLAYVEISAAEQGRVVELAEPSLTESGPVSAIVRFGEGAAGHPLYPALAARYVDRRRHLKPPSTPELPQLEGVTLQALTSPAPELLKTLADADVAFVSDRHNREFMVSWTRTSQEEADRTGDGIYSRAWMFPPLTLFMMGRDALFRAGALFGAHRLAAAQICRKLASSHLMLARVSLADAHADNLERLVALGRGVMFGWLSLTARGLVAQPASAGLLARYMSTRGLLPVAWAQRFQPSTDGIDALLGSDPPGQREEPMFLLRYGLPIGPYPQAYRTRRLARDQVYRSESP